MSRVNEIKAAVLCLFKVIVLEICRYERIAARSNHVADLAAAASAADGDLAHRLSRIGKSDAWAGQHPLDKGCKRRKGLLGHLTHAYKPIRPSLRVRADGVQNLNILQSQPRCKHVLDPMPFSIRYSKFRPS